MTIKKQSFGVLSDGTALSLYTVDNGAMCFSCTDYGATVTSVMIPDSKGHRDDITLGFPTIEGYMQRHDCYFGVCVGRFCNRIGNAQFTLEGKTYNLDKNDNGANTLHGGFMGYNRMVWNSEIVETAEGSGVTFYRTSPDDEQGFPGNLTLQVTYLLTHHNELILKYSGMTDKPTPISLTNHSFWNLKGSGKGNIRDNIVCIDADSILEVNDKLIPTGKKIDVTGTPFDFRQPKAVGKEIDDVPGGYDHNFCINKQPGEIKLCATVAEPTTGRGMAIYTNQPGVQFYTGNFLKDTSGKNGDVYNKHDALCLETQAFPDAPNQKDFPSCILYPGSTYESVTIHKFTW